VTTRTVIQAAIVPMVAVLIFAAQVYRQYAYDLTVWKGGGMGMFASIDGPSTRLIKVFLIAPDGTLRPIATLPTDLKQRADRAVVEPAESNLRSLASAVNQRHWVLTGMDEVPPPPGIPGEGSGVVSSPRIGPAARSSPLSPIAFTGTRIEFIKIGFDITSFAITAERALVFELDR